jgi:hypothetical protein
MRRVRRKRLAIIAGAAFVTAGLAYVASRLMALATCESGTCAIVAAPGPMVLLVAAIAALTAASATRDLYG